MTEMVDHPQHYKSADGSEVIDIIQTATKDLNGIEAFDTGNMIKYICRWKWKNGIEDVKKCRWYARHLMNNRNLFIHGMHICDPDRETLESARAAAYSFTCNLSGDEYSLTHMILTSTIIWWYDSDRYLSKIIRACDELIEHIKKQERKMD